MGFDFEMFLTVLQSCGDFCGQLAYLAIVSLSFYVNLIDTGWEVMTYRNLFTGVKNSIIIDWRANPIFSLFHTVWELLEPIVRPALDMYMQLPTALALLLIIIQFMLVIGLIKFFKGLL